MAEILFVTWDGGGNVPPALAIADELRRRGHGTHVLGHRGQETAVTAHGHPFTPYAEAEGFVGSEPASVPRLVRLFSDRGMGRDLVTVAARQGADLVVVDALLMGALDAAARAGVRYVPLQHCFDGYQRGGWLRGPVGLWGRARGLRPVDRWNGAELALSATLASLDPGAARAPVNLRFTGPVVEPPRATASFADRTVLVSLSTFHYAGMRAVLQRVVDATEGLGARVLVTTGPVIEPSEVRARPDVEVHRSVPHGELMPTAALVVGHGGHGTAMRALAHDLPLLVLPMHPLLDHPVVGRAVQEAGAGLMVSRRAPVPKLRSAMARLLEDGPHRRAAAALGTQIRAADGPRTAADHVETLLSPPSPQPSPQPAPGPGRPAPRP